jgi:tetratricopeptide (TPR) repeat protein
MDRPLECRTLTVMREARGRTAKQLALDLGLKADTLYAYESGKHVPSRNLLNRAALALGLTVHHVDRTIRYLRQTDAEAGVSGAAGEESRTDAEIERISLVLAEEWEEIHRQQLTRSRRLARALAEREAALVHFPRLRACPADERMSVVRENPAFQTWAVSELACHESIEAAADDPAHALAWTDVAVLIAELAPGEEAFRARSQGYAAFHRGNAFRAKGKLPESNAEFSRADVLWKAGAPGDPERLLNEARVLGMEASLRREQGELRRALDLLDRALAIERSAHRTYLLINRANVLEDLGDSQEAVATLRRTIPLVDPERAPRLSWSLRFNLLVNLCHVERYTEAANEIEEVRALTLRHGYRIGLARLVWLEGWIAAGLGLFPEAENAFEQVRQEFLARDIPFDAGRASLELAVLYMEQGRTADVQKLARELAPIFQSQKASHELVAALMLFRDSVEEETLTLEMVRRFVDDFRRSRFK